MRILSIKKLLLSLICFVVMNLVYANQSSLQINMLMQMIHKGQLGNTSSPWFNLKSSIAKQQYSLLNKNSYLNNIAAVQQSNSPLDWFHKNAFRPGSVWQIVISPLNPKMIYIRLNEAGVFKSTDGGQTWKEINKGLRDTSFFFITNDSKNNNLYGYNFAEDIIYQYDTKNNRWFKITGLKGIMTLAVHNDIIYANADNGRAIFFFMVNRVHSE